MLTELLIKAFVAGLLASVACGLGALPLLIRRLDPAKHTGLGYACAGGLMFAASVYHLILPALQQEQTTWSLPSVLPVLGGIVLGAGFLSVADRWLSRLDKTEDQLSGWGGKAGLLIFLAMTIHSIPEGVAVGVGYASGARFDTELGSYIALAIAFHNIPEGLAVAIPMRSAGASIKRCFFVAFLTSLPQPIAALPAVWAAWLFVPLMPVLMGFAAGAMIFLIMIELVPEPLHTESPRRIAWAFTVGFCVMLLIQVLL